MRLDRFLATVRVLKSRSLVKTAADKAMISLNGRPAKPAAKVRAGDIIEIDVPRFYKKIKVRELPPKNLRKSEAANFYELLESHAKKLL